MKQSSPRVTIVTAGHLATCPRMVKAADALAANGYDVRVISAVHTAWAVAGDASLRSTRSWRWMAIDYRRETARRRQVVTGARRLLAERISRILGAPRTPLPIAIRAYARIHDELVRAIVEEPCDLVYGGTTGALAAVAEAAQRLRVPYGLDLEDFHSGECEEPSLQNALAERIESTVLRRAGFLTAGSPMIAEAYARKYRVAPLPLHNTFPLGARNGAPSRPGPLRLYWFSQTVDSNRGLEHVIPAIGESAVPAELHLRGRAAPGYAQRLHTLRQRTAPALKLTISEPAPPDALVDEAAGYDLGLSCDEPRVANHRMCLSNKLFTYLAAGVPVALSDTPAHVRIAADLGAAAVVYVPTEPRALIECLRRWTADRTLRDCAARAARAAAERRWHWEHPADRGALLEAVAAGLARRS